MTSASLQPQVDPLRRAVAEAREQPTRFAPFRRPLATERDCSHDRLVFDDINDVHCDRCGQDFTG